MTVLAALPGVDFLVNIAPEGALHSYEWVDSQETNMKEELNMEVYDWNIIPGEEVRPGVVRQVFTGKGSMLVMTEVAPGFQESPHEHPFEQLVYVVEGNVRFTLGDKEMDIEAGSVFRVPPRTPHGAQVSGSKPCRLLAVYGPPREDYLPHCEYQKD